MLIQSNRISQANVVYRCFDYLRRRSGGQKALFSRAVNASVPALPTACITVRQAVSLWKRHFEQRGVAEPAHSSQYIIAHLLGAKTIENLGQDKMLELLTHEQVEQIWILCCRRLSRMPVQYVIEEWDFRDLTLKMKPPVFIPRPETEELVGLVLKYIQMKISEGGEAEHKCLEVGCGSGAISLSLLKSLPQLKVIALDQSKDAVDLTRENALKLGLQDRLEVHHVDVIKDADTVLNLCSRVSTLVSNPPYLFSEDMRSLEPEILRFEDHAALDGGDDGMNVIRQILVLAPKLLFNHGRLYLEVDPRHPELIRRWLEHVEELQYISTQHDMNNRPRFCILQKEERNGPQ